MTPPTRADRLRAKAAVHKAIRAGRLPRRAEACIVCGARHGMPGKSIHGYPTRIRIVWHHPNYAEPLRVVAVCMSCHANIHEQHIPDPGTGELYPFDHGHRGRLNFYELPLPPKKQSDAA